MGAGDHAWSFVSWLVGFAVFVAVTIFVQWGALKLYTAWWESGGAPGPVPEDTTQAITWGAGFLVGLAAGKLAGDHV